MLQKRKLNYVSIHKASSTSCFLHACHSEFCSERLVRRCCFCLTTHQLQNIIISSIIFTIIAAAAAAATTTTIFFITPEWQHIESKIAMKADSTNTTAETKYKREDKTVK